MHPDKFAANWESGHGALFFRGGADGSISLLKRLIRGANPGATIIQPVVLLVNLMKAVTYDGASVVESWPEFLQVKFPELIRFVKSVDIPGFGDSFSYDHIYDGGYCDPGSPGAVEDFISYVERSENGLSPSLRKEFGWE